MSEFKPWPGTWGPLNFHSASFNQENGQIKSNQYLITIDTYLKSLIHNYTKLHLFSMNAVYREISLA